MRNIFENVSTKRKAWLAVIFCTFLLSLVLGLTFGLGNFGKVNDDYQDVQGGVPVNRTLWTDNASNVDTSWQGTGTKDDPFLITSAAELAGLAYNVNKAAANVMYKGTAGGGVYIYYYSGRYFRQTVDIDVSMYYWDPIGSMAYFFGGNYDGGGHTVAGIFTNSSCEYAGLFGCVIGASIQNVGIIESKVMIDSEIVGKSSAGGIIAYSFMSPVSISNCYNRVKVSTTINSIASNVGCGGILGISYGGGFNITDCYNTGEVRGSYPGGILGGYYTNSYTYTFSNCYSVGMEVINSMNVTIVPTNCYTNERTYVTIDGVDCWYDEDEDMWFDEDDNWYDYDEVIAVDGEVKLKDRAWLASTLGWDMTFDWGITPTWNDGYPDFRNRVVYTLTLKYDCELPNMSLTGHAGENIDLTIPNRPGYKFMSWKRESGVAMSFILDIDKLGGSFTGYAGDDVLIAVWEATHWIAFADTSWAVTGVGDSEANPYIIDTPEKLAGLAKNVNNGGVSNYTNKYFKQTANFDLSRYKWVSIGASHGNAFNGKYDGGNYSISGINLDDSQGDYQGLFGYVGNDFNCNATIKNVIVKNSYMTTSKQYLGGIVGLAQYSGNIINCRSEVTLENTHASGYAGGIFTTSGSTVTITGCVFIGNVTATGSNGCAGGIAAAHMMGTMSNCHVSNSNIKGSKAGGLSGDGYQPKINNSIVTNCVIEASDAAGLFIGNANSATLSNLSGNGYIKFTGSNISSAGAMVGSASSSVTLTNCSAIVNSNVALAKFANENSTISSCYSIMNGNKAYSSGDFADWGLVAGMNNDLPMQKALFWMADCGDSVSPQWFAEHGYVLT